MKTVSSNWSHFKDKSGHMYYTYPPSRKTKQNKTLDSMELFHLETEF